MKSLIDISEAELLSFKVLDWGYTEQLSPISFEYFEDWVNNSGHEPLS